MAAAAMAGLILVLHSVAGDKSGYHIGRQLWFGFIAVYGVVVYVVCMHWVPIHEDFWCNGNITNTCLIECFEKSFSSPVVGIWYFFFFIFLTLFFFMEFFMTQIQHKQIKAKSVEPVAGEVEEGSMVELQEHIPSPKSILSFHQEKMLLLLYLLYFLLQVGAQCVFLFFLMYQHLPLVSQAIIHCSTKNCSGPYICLIRGTMEKRMSTYTLITLSFMIILFCSGLFMYSIHHYLLKGLGSVKFWLD